MNIVATPASGYAFDKWIDGNTQASRTVTMNADKTLVASFKVAQTQGGKDEGGVGEYLTSVQDEDLLLQSRC